MTSIQAVKVERICSALCRLLCLATDHHCETSTFKTLSFPVPSHSKAERVSVAFCELNWSSDSVAAYQHYAAV